MATRYVTIMLIPDSGEQRLGWRIPRWSLFALAWGLGVVVVGILMFFVFYGHVVTRAVMAEKLKAENEELRKYRYKVALLEQNVEQMRQFVGRLATLAGIDVALPAVPDDSTFFAQIDRTTAPSLGATLERPGDIDWSLPVGLPVKGFVSQDFEITDQTQYHPGVDIACAIGTPVLATGSGRVEYAAFDSTYGYMAIVRHNDSVTTVYGHNSELLVQTGQDVAVGGRIALSGNTGVSTAPHVHYEIRIHDKPINPLDNPYD